MRAAVLAGLIVAMSGQCFAQAAPKVDEKRLRAAFEEKLKDAESARFRAIKQGNLESEGSWRVCGEVNAKNSFGAYEGFQPFLGRGFKESNAAPIEYQIAGVGEAAGNICARHHLR